LNAIGPIRSRSRTLNSVLVTPSPTKVYTFPGNVLVSTSSNPSFVGTESTESISSSTRPISGCDYRSPAYVAHSKRKVVYTGKGDQVSVVFQPSASPTHRVEYYGYHLHSLAAHAAAEFLARSSFSVQTGKTVLNANAQGMINQVFLDLRPDLTTMSLPNFLIEIAEIKGLFKLWKQNVGVARNLAGARLNQKYGWKPTLGDLSAALTGLRRMADTIHAFEKSAGIVQRRQETLLSDSTTTSGTFNYTGSVYYPCTWTATLNRHVQGFLVYKGEPLAVVGNLNKGLLGFLDTLGVELNPRIVWDAIPFSFVLDNFFGIGGYLDQFKWDTLPLPIKCTDCFLQYKETLTVHSHLSLDVNSPVSTPATVCPPVASVDEFFHRIPLNPNDDIVLSAGWRKPKTDTLLTLAALAVVLSPKRWLP
jgi:hypothetical protein